MIIICHEKPDEPFARAFEEFIVQQWVVDSRYNCNDGVCEYIDSGECLLGGLPKKPEIECLEIEGDQPSDELAKMLMNETNLLLWIAPHRNREKPVKVEILENAIWARRCHGVPIVGVVSLNLYDEGAENLLSARPNGRKSLARLLLAHDKRMRESPKVWMRYTPVGRELEYHKLDNDLSLAEIEIQIERKKTGAGTYRYSVLPRDNTEIDWLMGIYCRALDAKDNVTRELRDSFIMEIPLKDSLMLLDKDLETPESLIFVNSIRTMGEMLSNCSLMHHAVVAKVKHRMVIERLGVQSQTYLKDYLSKINASLEAKSSNFDKGDANVNTPLITEVCNDVKAVLGEFVPELTPQNMIRRYWFIDSTSQEFFHDYSIDGDENMAKLELVEFLHDLDGVDLIPVFLDDYENIFNEEDNQKVFYEDGDFELGEIDKSDLSKLNFVTFLLCFLKKIKEKHRKEKFESFDKFMKSYLNEVNSSDSFSDKTIKFDAMLDAAAARYRNDEVSDDPIWKYWSAFEGGWPDGDNEATYKTVDYSSWDNVFQSTPQSYAKWKIKFRGAIGSKEKGERWTKIVIDIIKVLESCYSQKILKSMAARKQDFIENVTAEADD